MDLWLLEFSSINPLAVERRIPVSTLEGNQRQALLSPSGDIVAFASDHSAASQIYLKLLGERGVSLSPWFPETRNCLIKRRLPIFLGVMSARVIAAMLATLLASCITSTSFASTDP